MTNRTYLTDEQLIERTVWLGLEGGAITKTRAAKLLKCCRQTVYNLVSAGRLTEMSNGLIEMYSLYDEARRRKCTIY